jgi:hypothetical protein
MQAKYFGVGIMTLLAALPAQAWDYSGHMLSAQIAYSRLTPEVRQRVDALVPLIPDFREVENGVKPQPYSFVTAACWMDDVRPSKKRDALSTWHFIDIPCGKDVDDVHQQNALDALKLAQIVLRSDADNKTKAEWLAILLHIVGDIHQPLHAVATDVGGNTFPISGVPGLDKRIRKDGKAVDRDKSATGENAGVYQRLHAFWDFAYRYDVVQKNNGKTLTLLYDLGNSARPRLTQVQTTSQSLQKYLSSDTALLNERDSAQWVRESNAIACDWVFHTPRMKQPSWKYFERAHDVACERLVLSGVRMANLLNELM